MRKSWTVTATRGVSRRSPRPGPSSALKLRHVLRALPPSAPGLTQDGPHFTLPLPAAAVPFLMPFIVNFTITNLRYTEDMGNLGSEIFNATERHLQQLVRAPQQFSLSTTLLHPAVLATPAHLPLMPSQLGPLFRNSIGSLYAGCRLTLLR